MNYYSLLLIKLCNIKYTTDIYGFDSERIYLLIFSVEKITCIKYSKLIINESCESICNINEVLGRASTT